MARVLPMSEDMKSRSALSRGLPGPGAGSVSTVVQGRAWEEGPLGL